MKRDFSTCRKAAAVLAGWGVFAAVAVIAVFQAGRAEAAQSDGGIEALSGQVTAYENVTCIGFFKTAGEEAAEYAVAQEPEHGKIEVEGDHFRYIPQKGRTGKDSFTYTATDENGRVSSPAAVEITVLPRSCGVIYNDMADHPYHTAAVHLAEEGVLTGERIGSEYFFRPQERVSRGEFLTMAMGAMKLEGLEDISVTGFCDDDSIPRWAKGYAAAALKCGALRGVPTADGVAFDASSSITFSEAAAVINRMLDLRDVDVSGRSAAYESWAGQAVANLEAVSVMAVGSFGSKQMAQEMNKGEVAQLLSAAMDFAEEERQSKSVLNWLF